MKLSREAMSLKVTSIPNFIIPYLKPRQNGGRSTFDVDAKLAPVNVGS
jgi:hypothetical protein